MLGLILTSLMTLAPIQEDVPQTQPPTAEEVEQTVERLEKALKDEDRETSLEVIKQAIQVPHADVTEVLADAAVAFDVRDVPLAALDALGRIDDPTNVSRLEKLHKKYSKKLEDEMVDWGVELFRALGRTGDAKALKVLGKGSLNGQELKLDRARVMALGKIRDPESLETLVSLYNRVLPRDTNKYADQMRASFAALTGENIGGGRNEISDWWNDNKRDLELPEVEPEIEAKKLRLVWDQFWGTAKKKKEGGGGGR